MDIRKLSKKEELTESVIDTSNFTQFLLFHINKLFELEEYVKGRAQNDFNMVQQQRYKDIPFLAKRSLESPTYTYYGLSFGIYLVFRHRFALGPHTFMLFLMVPAFIDYLKRRKYMLKYSKEFDQYKNEREIVFKLINTRMKFVTPLDVYQYLFQLSLKTSFDDTELLPIVFDI